MESRGQQQDVPPQEKAPTVTGHMEIMDQVPQNRPTDSTISPRKKESLQNALTQDLMSNTDRQILRVRRNNADSDAGASSGNSGSNIETGRTYIVDGGNCKNDKDPASQQGPPQYTYFTQVNICSPSQSRSQRTNTHRTMSTNIDRSHAWYQSTSSLEHEIQSIPPQAKVAVENINSALNSTQEKLRQVAKDFVEYRKARNAAIACNLAAGRPCSRPANHGQTHLMGQAKPGARRLSCSCKFRDDVKLVEAGTQTVELPKGKTARTIVELAHTQIKHCVDYMWKFYRNLCELVNDLFKTRISNLHKFPVLRDLFEVCKTIEKKCDNCLNGARQQDLAEEAEKVSKIRGDFVERMNQTPETLRERGFAVIVRNFLYYLDNILLMCVELHKQVELLAKAWKDTSPKREHSKDGRTEMGNRQSDLENKVSVHGNSHNPKQPVREMNEAYNDRMECAKNQMDEE